MQLGSCLMAGACALSIAVAGNALAGEEVDLELSLAIDSSGSINSNEFALQMNGYRAAFLNSDVQASIANAPKGVAVNVVFFASSAKVGVPFTILRSEADAAAFANTLGGLSSPKPTGIGSLTDIHEGIDLSVSTIFGNDIDSDVQVIDVSGDGRPTTGENTATARNDAVNAGIDVINGLAVGSNSVTSFFNDNVIAGPGAKTFEADNFADFERVVTQKIKFEIQDNIPDPDPDPGPGTGIPSPTAAFAGLALLGVVGVRRRRSA